MCDNFTIYSCHFSIAFKKTYFKNHLKMFGHPIQSGYHITVQRLFDVQQVGETVHLEAS